MLYNSKLTGGGMKTTLNKIRPYNPCRNGWKKLLKNLGKTEADDEPLALTAILESNGVIDALWCLRAVSGHEREMRLFAVESVRRVQHLITDKRSLGALDVSERYANGLATQAELTAARDAAYAVVDAARAAAADAVSDAAVGAAYAVVDAAAAAAAAAAGDAAWAAAYAARVAAAWAVVDAADAAVVAASDAASDAAAYAAAYAARTAAADAAWAARDAASDAASDAAEYAATYAADAAAAAAAAGNAAWAARNAARAAQANLFVLMCEGTL